MLVLLSEQKRSYLCNENLPKTMRKLPDYLNEEEANKLLDLAAKDSFRNYLMVKLMWQCGLRISEVSNPMVRDIDFLDKKVRRKR